MVELVCSMCQALGSIPSTRTKEQLKQLKQLTCSAESDEGKLNHLGRIFITFFIAETKYLTKASKEGRVYCDIQFKWKFMMQGECLAAGTAPEGLIVFSGYRKQ